MGTTSQQVRAAGRDWATARQLLSTYPLSVEDVTVGDAELAAQLWSELPTLSLADRLCIALGRRAGGEVWTADRAWGTNAPIHQIR